MSARHIRDRSHKRQHVARQANHAGPAVRDLYIRPSREHHVKVTPNTLPGAGLCGGGRTQAAPHTKEEPIIWQAPKIMEQAARIKSHLIACPACLFLLCRAQRSRDNHIRLTRHVPSREPRRQGFRAVAVGRDYDLIRARLMERR